MSDVTQQFIDMRIRALRPDQTVLLYRLLNKKGDSALSNLLTLVECLPREGEIVR